MQELTKEQMVTKMKEEVLLWEKMLTAQTMPATKDRMKRMIQRNTELINLANINATS